MDGLEPGRVHVPRGTADQRAARKHLLRYRLPAAGCERTRAVGNAGGVLDQACDGWMLLEALELVEGRKRRVAIVEMDDEAEIDTAIVRMIEEAAAGGRIVERPAEEMIDAPHLVQCGRDFPDFFDPESEFLRGRFGVQLEPVNELLAERPARALADQGVFGPQPDARGVAGLGVAVAVEPQITSDDAFDCAVIRGEDINCSGHGVDIDAESLRLVGQPANEVAERGDDAVMRLHHRREEEVRQPKIATAREDVEDVARDGGADRGAALAPVRDELIEARWVHDGAREDVATDLGRFLNHGNGRFRTLLLEADRRCETSGPSPDNDDVGIDDFAVGHKGFRVGRGVT